MRSGELSFEARAYIAYIPYTGSMSTTVLVSGRTRDALARSRDRMGAGSMDEAIRMMMRDAAPTAQDLWRRHRRKAEAIVAKHGVTRLIAFGSRVRDDRHPGSDLDIVVEFPVEEGISGLFRLRDELSQALGVEVDIGSVPPPGSRLWRHIQEEGVAFVGPQP